MVLSRLVCPLATVSLFMTTACAGTTTDAVPPETPKTPVASVEVQPSSLPTLAPGGRQQLTAMVLDAKGQPLAGRSVAWTSATPAVATVDAGGLVTAVSDGSGLITASSEGQSGSVPVTVRTPVARVELSATTLTLSPGATQAVTATLRGATGNVLSNRSVAWTTTNPAVATVTTAGTISAVAPGQATITASSEGIVGAVTVTVRSAVASIAILQGSGSLQLGQDRSLTAAAQDAQGSVIPNIAIAWSSSNNTVATVDSAGRVAALAIGSTTIAATGDGRTGSVTITVTPLTPRATPLVAGLWHSCALASDGNVFCWGENSQGRLGDGTTSMWRPLPAPISGAVRFTTLGNGGYHTCGIATDGYTYCWGQHADGYSLYDGATGNRRSPQRVNTTERFVQVDGGDSHTCGLTAEGRAFCWGSNTAGGLGDGTREERFVPVAVVTTTRFIDVAAGGNHTCALAADRRAWCWGFNEAGQLGNGTRTSSNVPVPVSGGLRFTSITTSSSHVCALREGSGEAVCWGGNGQGQVGNGSPNAIVEVPVAVAPGVSFRMLSVGLGFSCGIVTDETVRCWGGNAYGQLGDGTLRPSSMPVAVPLLRGARWIGAGDSHTCVALTAGPPQCWGRNEWGQLGTGTDDVVTTPSVVPGLSGAVSLAVSEQHACANTSAMTTVCWGRNANGQLGDGTRTGRTSPIALPGRQSAQLVSAAGGTCSRELDGSVWCWGGAFGRNLPGPITSSTGAFSRVATLATAHASSNHICGLSLENTAFCSGGNRDGQLGRGNMGAASEFLAVVGGLSFRQLSVGYATSCGITLTNVPYCWGWNEFGQLGTGNKGTSQSSPQPLATAVRFSRIVAGLWEACGLDLEGFAYCWGPNWLNKLGNGTSDEALAPVAVLGGSRYMDLVISRHATCGLTLAGDVRCWGSNLFGELGTGSRDGASRIPVAAGGGLRFQSLGAGEDFVCGIATDQRVYCWGNNSTGVIGPTRGATPQPVALSIALATP